MSDKTHCSIRKVELKKINKITYFTVFFYLICDTILAK